MALRCPGGFAGGLARSVLSVRVVSGLGSDALQKVLRDFAEATTQVAKKAACCAEAVATGVKIGADKMKPEDLLNMSTQIVNLCTFVTIKGSHLESLLKCVGGKVTECVQAYMELMVVGGQLPKQSLQSLHLVSADKFS